jgi:uncharacterized oligopeptide transporter (OPT) family protein
MNFKSTLKSLFNCVAAAGFGSAANGLAQAAIASVTGISPLLAAFHPATIAVGCVMGLTCYAALLIGNKKTCGIPQSPKEQVYQYPILLSVYNIRISL